MARKSAYNTKAETARRAAQRERLLQEVASRAEAGDELVPFLSAWTQFQRRRAEYRELFGVDYTTSVWDVPEDQRVEQAREHAFMAFAHSYVGQAALEFATGFMAAAGRAGNTAGMLAMQAHPYTAEQEAKVVAMYPDPG